MIDEYLEKWLIKARNDLKTAENESQLSPEDMVTDAICFKILRDSQEWHKLKAKFLL